jgi:hypothetical protein
MMTPLRKTDMHHRDVFTPRVRAVEDRLITEPV